MEQEEIKTEEASQLYQFLIAFVIVITCIACFVSFFIWYAYKIKQEVVLNDINIDRTTFIKVKIAENTFDKAKYLAYSHVVDGILMPTNSTADSTEIADFVKAEDKRLKAILKEYSSPYILTTSYKSYKLEFKGSFEEVDSMKCVQYTMIKQYADSIEAIEQLEEHRTDSLQAQLKLLNNKPCKK